MTGLFVLQKRAVLGVAANKTTHSEQMKAKWNDKYLVFVKTLIKIMLHPPNNLFVSRNAAAPATKRLASGALYWGGAAGACLCASITKQLYRFVCPKR